MFIYIAKYLTHYGLVSSYGDIGLGQRRLRQWLVAWRHEAITWANFDNRLLASIPM